MDYLEPCATFLNVGLLHGIHHNRVGYHIRFLLNTFPHLKRAVDIKTTIGEEINRQVGSRSLFPYVVIVSWFVTHKINPSIIANKLGFDEANVFSVLERAEKGVFGKLVQRMRRGLSLISSAVVEPVMDPASAVTAQQTSKPAATLQQKSKPAATAQQKSKPAVTPQQKSKPAANRPPVVKRALDATTTGNTEFQRVHTKTTDSALRILNWIMRHKASYAQAAGAFKVTAHYIWIIVGNAWDGKYGTTVQSTVMRNLPQEPEPESYAETMAKRARLSTEAAEPSLLSPPQLSAPGPVQVPSLLSPPQISVTVLEEEAWLLAGSFFAEPSDDF